MLVLTRKLNESIQIGPNIKITIAEIRGGAVRIGVEAPRNTRVMRTELVDNAKERPYNPFGTTILPANEGEL